VGRVRDDHGRIRHRRHDAFAQPGGAYLPQPRLDLGIAFLLLELVLELAFRHALPAAPADALVDGVAEGQEAVNGEDAEEQLHGERQRRRQEADGLEARHAVEPIALVPQDRDRHRADDGDLEEALDELDDCLTTEQALEAGHRRHAAGLRLERLQRP
jgi:hypothetical protein